MVRIRTRQTDGGDGLKSLIGVALACAGLAACAPKPITPAEAAALRPADPHIAQLYEGACKACHANGDSGAPLTHDHAAWAPRWKQGEAVLLDHVVQGHKGMPALGQCVACQPTDFQALIRFMADHEGDAK